MSPSPTAEGGPPHSKARTSEPPRTRGRAQIGVMLDVGIATMHVREDGPSDGTPLLLVHGFDASMHWFDKLTPLLTDSYRVIRVDLVGYGCTGGKWAPDGPAQGSIVAAVLDTLDVTDVTALGHSFGCDVALSVAEQSSRVSRVVLVGQAPDYSYANFPSGQALLTRPLVGTVMHKLAWPAVTEYFGRIAFAPGFVIGAGLDADRMFSDHRAMAVSAARTVLVERKKRLTDRPLDVQVREIGLPTLAVHGRSDQMYDCETTLARYAAAGADVEVIEGAGHSPAVERPEQLAQAIRAFRERTS